jgi:hypothetical protein
MAAAKWGPTCPIMRTDYWRQLKGGALNPKPYWRQSKGGALNPKPYWRLSMGGARRLVF